MLAQWFSTGFDVPHLWIQDFSSHSWTDLAILSAAVAGVCVGKYIASTFLFLFRNRKASQERRQRHSVRIRIFFHALASLGTMLHVLAGYLLMLAVMLYNVWICLVVVLFSGCLFFFTSWSHGKIYSFLYSHTHSQKVEIISSEDSDANSQSPHLHADLKRESTDTAHLIEMASVQTNQIDTGKIKDESPSGDTTTLLVRPDLIAQNSEESAQHRIRSGSDPLLDKYPVLRFHNNCLRDTTPIPNRKSKPLEFDELDQLIKELSEA